MAVFVNCTTTAYGDYTGDNRYVAVTPNPVDPGRIKRKNRLDDEDSFYDETICSLHNKSRIIRTRYSIRYNDNFFAHCENVCFFTLSKNCFLCNYTHVRA